jgi:hypothetical protein
MMHTDCDVAFGDRLETGVMRSVRLAAAEAEQTDDLAVSMLTS